MKIRYLIALVLIIVMLCSCASSKNVDERPRRRKPSPTPEWVKRIPQRCREVLVERHLYKDGEVWGLARRLPDGELPYDEAGSAAFYRFVRRFDLWDKVPPLTDHERQKALRFWQSWQDPETGVFKDPRDPDRRIHEKCVVEIIRHLGGEPLYPRKQSQQAAGRDESGKIDTTIFLKRTRDDPNWAEGGWAVAQDTGRQAREIFYAINDGHTYLIPDLEKGIEQIMSHQAPDGLWGSPSGRLAVRLGGALQIIHRLYFSMGTKVPRNKELADSLIKYERSGDWYDCGSDFCVPQNVLILTAYCLEVSDYRREDLLGVIESELKVYEQEWVLPDGTLLIHRGDKTSACVENVHMQALGVIGYYLNWQDCPFENKFRTKSEAELDKEFRYRLVINQAGSARVVDTRK